MLLSTLCIFFIFIFFCIHTVMQFELLNILTFRIICLSFEQIFLYLGFMQTVNNVIWSNLNYRRHSHDNFLPKVLSITNVSNVFDDSTIILDRAVHTDWCAHSSLVVNQWIQLESYTVGCSACKNKKVKLRESNSISCII